MKIKIKTTTEKEIELPKYFRLSNSAKKVSYMVIDENSILAVNNWSPNGDFSYGLYPSIQGVNKNGIPFELQKIIPISETEFKTEFIKVSVQLEEMMN
jgi:hypothetical protein